MPFGYWGKMLNVNLSTGKIDELTLPEDYYRKYIGGSGLGVKLLTERTDKTTDPLGEENVLIFLTGPFVGTGVTNGGRYHVSTKSPLTGILGEADSGGKWGTKLKRTGYDGIILEGRSDHHVYLLIEEESARLLNADEYWGKDTFELDDALSERHGKTSSTLSIGPAGENLVKFAALMNDGYEARAAARTGVGAVMGSKNLKAITVCGNLKTPVAHPEELKVAIKKWSKMVYDNTDAFRTYGTTVGLEGIEAAGDLPVRNWQLGSFDVSKMTGAWMKENILAKNGFCEQCALGCGRLIKIEDGAGKGKLNGGPEYETVGIFGPNLLIDDLISVQRSNEICNRLGMDTISAGSTIAFLFEAYENGLIDEESLMGVKPEWGNAEAVWRLLEMIAYRQGIGDVLAEGVRKASEIIGGISPEFAVHVKGLEFPGHDPRASSASGLSYATGTRGACHLAGFTADFMNGTGGFGFMPAEEYDRFGSNDRIVNEVVVYQNAMAQYDSMILCKFVMFGYLDSNMEAILEFFHYVLGWDDMTVEEWLETGERIYNLKRMYLVEQGVSRKDDVLPPRMTKKRGTGSAAEHIPDVANMLDMYYKQRGWDLYGIPTEGTLKRLGLS